MLRDLNGPCSILTDLNRDPFIELALNLCYISPMMGWRHKHSGLETLAANHAALPHFPASRCNVNVGFAG